MGHDTNQYVFLITTARPTARTPALIAHAASTVYRFMCCFCYHKHLWMSDCMSNGLQYLRKRGRSACIIPPGYNISASAEDQYALFHRATISISASAEDHHFRLHHTTQNTNLEAHIAAPRSTGLQKDKRCNGIGVATGPNVVGAADDAAAWRVCVGVVPTLRMGHLLPGGLQQTIKKILAK